MSLHRPGCAHRSRAGLLDVTGAYEDTLRRTGFTPVAAKVSR
ncbi:MAG: hypothetical protein QOI78_2854 [Actinomycetota bacterium]|nr:hypothetical protein [Actinomycetota bacterium]